jgi:hypothetical protein
MPINKLVIRTEEMHIEELIECIFEKILNEKHHFS